jgi:hypothetical protein
MRLIASTLYDPTGGAVVSKSTASAIAMTALDTTNLRLSVTVPSHGKVRVVMRGCVSGATTFPSIVLGVLEGATLRGRVPPKQVLGNTAVATALVHIEADYTLTGLTPGAANWDAAYGVETAVASTGIKYGGPNNTTAGDAAGGFLFEVWDPDPYPTNFSATSIDASGRVDVAKIGGTTQTARDIGASVLLSAGTGTGQLDFTSGVVKANVTQNAGSAIVSASGRQEVNVSHFGGSAGTFASGRPEVNTSHFGGSAGTFASGRPEVNTSHIAGAAVSASTAQIGVNVVNLGGSAVDATAGLINANVKQINAVAAATPGAAGGVLISGSNAGTTTFGALTVTGATTHTGNVVLSDGLTISAPSTLNRSGVTITGNGAGSGITITSGSTGDSIALSSAAGAGIDISSSSHGILVASSAGDGINITAASGRSGIRSAGGSGIGDGITLTGGVSGIGLRGNISGSIGSVTGSVGSVAANGITAASIAADAIGASELAADAVTEIAAGVWANATRTLSAGTNIVLVKGTGVTGFNDLDAAGVRAAVGLASANLDTQLSAIAGYVDTEIGTLQSTATAIKSKTDNLPAAPAATSDIPTANENADALLDRAAGVETALTVRQWFRLGAGALFGKSSGLNTTTATFRDTNDTKDRIVATVDADGNRSAVTLDAA